MLQKNSNSKIISSHKQEELFCEKCGCKFQKNGKTKDGIQKYICPGCKNTFSETTNTIIYHSKLSFEIWSNVIDNLISKNNTTNNVEISKHNGNSFFTVLSFIFIG